MPISTTALRCEGRRRSKVRGRPMSLLKLPWVARAWSGPGCQARKMLAIICVTVVLPLLPVTASKGSENCWRQPAANSPKASKLLGTSKPTKPAAAKPCSATAAPAPAAWAWDKNACASKRSPRKATNKSPGCKLRVSVWTRSHNAVGAPTNRAPRIHCWAWAKLSCMALMPRPPRPSKPGPAAHRRTAGAAR